jgi:dienelactone hydrolase
MPLVCRFSLVFMCLAAIDVSATGRTSGDTEPQPKPPVQTNGEIQSGDNPPLSGTRLLTTEGDIASQLVEGVDRFLLREIDRSIERRAVHWKRDLSSAEAYNRSIEPNRKRLAHILGMRDPRVPFDAPELMSSTARPALIARGARYEVLAVRWPAFGDVHAEGLLLVPTDRKTLAHVIAIPDADHTPEQICGLAGGVPEESQFARRLADNGCRVLVPVLIDRRLEKRNGRANLTSREFLYRSAFELGRQLIGYELQKVLAGVDWFTKEGGSEARIGVFGFGEGGMLALFAAALDPRIDACGVSGFFGSRQKIWNEPIDRNVFGLLDQFGDAELATMVSPRPLVVENRSFPKVTLPSQGGAPAELAAPADALKEVQRAERLMGGTGPGKARITYVDSGPERVEPAFGGAVALVEFLGELGVRPDTFISDRPPTECTATVDPAARQQRQMHELDRHSQKLLVDSPYVRQDFMKNLDTSSLEKYQQSTARYREIFRDDVIGRFDLELLSPDVRTRQAYDKEKWIGYEVVMDVFPDVIAYGVLLLPKDLKQDGSEKRPVVVCQHGLEGRPKDVLEGDVAAYHDFAAKLAERGFITFAPQNLYIFQDRFRTLQRKANPLGKTLFSIMVPQHQQITDWLKTLPYVDPDRIAFYGLSYGGKSAMRIPPLVSNYCLSICSADFNEWVWKNASSHPRNQYTYVWTGEYEIFEFDLGSTFNYAEMAALIAPRPFMVERGHFDGVAPDETVGYEFAKVFNLYDARLNIGDRCELEWFVGPHTINGKGTFDFLHKHLKWPVSHYNR